MEKELFTIGYEEVAIDDFITNLQANNINCIIDVRELPLSRKKGFSKQQLAQRLQTANIHYIHIGQLGTPKQLRDDLKLNRDYSSFFKTMDELLATKQETIETAYNYVMNNTCCLMCYERLADQCHRKIVAEKIKNKKGDDIRITHI